ncbi:hypothetical protein HPB50_001247 [Hyalomma asiaticum]|uniref:Uncharacterized protein n=1 Tax=Hyalomma asiaticum TaxID=266040 RepID=A0ACB7RX72_HYAAI|nr:hypothetical protein HPB50_001247 [Hyalomma asiaticum]
MASAVTDGGGRPLWSDEATLKVLNLIRDLDVVHVLKSKRQRNQQTFMTIEELMSPLGYDWSWQQIRCHWKNLKSRYNNERRNLRPGQKSAWKYYNAMDALLKQPTRAEDSASGRGDDSDISSGAENSAGKLSCMLWSLNKATVAKSHAPGRPSQHDSDEYIVPTLQEHGSNSSTGIVQQRGAATSVELETAVANMVQVKEEVEADGVQCKELHAATTNGSCKDTEPQPMTPMVRVISSADRSLGLSPECTDLQQIEQILSEPDIAASVNLQDKAHAESQSSSNRRSTDVRARTSRRYFFTTGTPGLSEKKARLELDILAATKRKLLAEQIKAEAEQRKAVAETLLLTEALKKYDEEKKKAMAETMFLVQERIRSEEETRRAAAMAAFHIEEKRKAAAEAEMLIEHKKYFMEQRKTEVIKRRMLLLELRKMRRELKLVP